MLRSSYRVTLDLTNLCTKSDLQKLKNIYIYIFSAQMGLKHVDGSVFADLWDQIDSHCVKLGGACCASQRSACAEKSDSWGMCSGPLYLHKPLPLQTDRQGPASARPLGCLPILVWFTRLLPYESREGHLLLLEGHEGLARYIKKKNLLFLFSGPRTKEPFCACAVLLLGDTGALPRAEPVNLRLCV